MSNTNRRCRSPILTNEVPLKKVWKQEEKKGKNRTGGCIYITQAD